jgi:ParB-like chromosome segregation protein Spo0J
MNIQKIKIDSLVEYPGNARKGNVGILVESLKVNGQYRPIIVQKSTNYVLAGNHLLKAASRLEWDEIDAVVIDVDDERALKIVLADNRTADLGEYDHDLLHSLLKELEDFAGTGYSIQDIDELEKLGGAPKEEKPEVEFSVALREENNYLILVFDDSVDWQAAIDTFGLKTVKAWDTKPNFQRLGLGRVIEGAPIVARLNENR